MRCARCSARINNNFRYCPHCGTPVDNPISEKEAKKHVKQRANGTGTAIKRANGTYTARVILGYETVMVTDKDGVTRPTLHARTVSKGGFTTRKDALNYCPKLLELKNTPSNSPPKDAPTLAHYWDLFYTSCQNRNIGLNTLSAYKTAWHKLAPLHSKKVSDICATELVTLIMDVAKTHDTAADCRTILRGMYRLACADKWATMDTLACIQIPPAESKEVQPFTIFEQKALWQLYESGDMDAAIPLLMISTGMMPVEAFKLRVDNIDFEHHVIVNAGRKTAVRKASDILIPDELVPVLEDLISNAMPSGYIFCQNETEWRKKYKAALQKAGCRLLQPYACRHTTATRLSIDGNIAPKTIARIMRWSTPAMLGRYTHTDDSHARVAINSVNKDAINKDDN